MTPREQLLDRVLDQIALDVEDRDFTAIEELISRLPDRDLIAYLPEYQPEETEDA